jgi:hypothetical protein
MKRSKKQRKRERREAGRHGRTVDQHRTANEAKAGNQGRGKTRREQSDG